MKRKRSNSRSSDASNASDVKTDISSHDHEDDIDVEENSSNSIKVEKSNKRSSPSKPLQQRPSSLSFGMDRLLSNKRKKNDESDTDEDTKSQCSSTMSPDRISQGGGGKLMHHSGSSSLQEGHRTDGSVGGSNFNCLSSMPATSMAMNSHLGSLPPSALVHASGFGPGSHAPYSWFGSPFLGKDALQSKYSPMTITPLLCGTSSTRLFFSFPFLFFSLLSFFLLSLSLLLFTVFLSPFPFSSSLYCLSFSFPFLFFSFFLVSLLFPIDTKL